ncbi:MAG: hypothetical protein M1816_001476 [Peltula sp. TS41687]|nr:MAG: hypothetical protein M1816_001476 [Peltula sp. TS41687]
MPQLISFEWDVLQEPNAQPYDMEMRYLHNIIDRYNRQDLEDGFIPFGTLKAPIHVSHTVGDAESFSDELADDEGEEEIAETDAVELTETSTEQDEDDDEQELQEKPQKKVQGSPRWKLHANHGTQG